jgi:hypothetical protein
MRPYRPFVFVAALIATVYLVSWFSFVDRGLLDARTHLWSRPASGELVLVVIDPASLQALRGWPWPWPPLPCRDFEAPGRSRRPTNRLRLRFQLGADA